MPTSEGRDQVHFSMQRNLADRADEAAERRRLREEQEQRELPSQLEAADDE
jgi:hypothetical protein